MLPTAALAPDQRHLQRLQVRPQVVDARRGVPLPLQGCKSKRLIRCIKDIARRHRRQAPKQQLLAPNMQVKGPSQLSWARQSLCCWNTLRAAMLHMQLLVGRRLQAFPQLGLACRPGRHRMCDACRRALRDCHFACKRASRSRTQGVLERVRGGAGPVRVQRVPGVDELAQRAAQLRGLQVVRPAIQVAAQDHAGALLCQGLQGLRAVPLATMYS